jgi:hypothetical protein
VIPTTGKALPEVAKKTILVRKLGRRAVKVTIILPESSSAEIAKIGILQEIVDIVHHNKEVRPVFPQVDLVIEEGVLGGIPLTSEVINEYGIVAGSVSQFRLHPFRPSRPRESFISVVDPPGRK